MPGLFGGRGGRKSPAPRGAMPRTDDEVRQLLRLLPRYRVLLHNDDYNTMDHVVMALVRIVGDMDADRAIQVMLEAHLHGVAEVITCPKEVAEHYRDGLQSYALTSTIEPA